MPIRSSPGFASCALGMLMALLLGACSETTVKTVEVTITGLDDSAVSVQVDAKLGDLPLQNTLSPFTSSLDTFKAHLSQDDTGELWLQAQAIGPDGCVFQQGNTTVTISDEYSYTATIEMAAQQGCLLVLYKTGGGAGKVTLSTGADTTQTVWTFPRPTDTGDTCPVEEDSPSMKQQVYTLNTQVKLGAAAIPSNNAQTTSYFGGWQEAFSGSGDCDVTIGPGTTTVRVDFLPTEACSLSRFCWEQPRPQGANLRQISGRNTNDVWAVGEAGSMLRWNRAPTSHARSAFPQRPPSSQEPGKI